MTPNRNIAFDGKKIAIVGTTAVDELLEKQKKYSAKQGVPSSGYDRRDFANTYYRNAHQVAIGDKGIWVAGRELAWPSSSANRHRGRHEALAKLRHRYTGKSASRGIS
jgi:hypothetical protein